MKRWIVKGAIGLSVLLFAGCGSYSEGYDDGYADGFYDGARYPEASMYTLFLRDEEGYALGGVPYYCVNPEGAVTPEYVTAPNGEFSFYAGERCTFDFYGFGGTPDDPLFIEDDVGDGKGDIHYVCDGGDNGVTDRFGRFEYLPDDRCKFYF